MTFAFEVIYHRRIGLSAETERCFSYIDDLWNIQVKKYSEAGEVKRVNLDEAALICRYITKNIRPGETFEVRCCEVVE